MSDVARFVATILILLFWMLLAYAAERWFGWHEREVLSGLVAGAVAWTMTNPALRKR